MYYLLGQLFLKITIVNSHQEASWDQALLLQLLWKQVHRERQPQRASEVSLWSPKLSVRGLLLALYHQRAPGRPREETQQG
jgi:hypothetical protein